MRSTTPQNMLLLAVPLAPLVGAIVAGLFGKQIGRAGAHTVTILGVAISFAISAWVLYAVVVDGARFNAHHLRVDERRRPEDGDRLPRRRPDRDDDVRRHLRLADGAHLHHRLHGRRPGLPALLHLHLAVHVLDADARDEQQLPAAVLRLGSGGPGVVPADRLLVHAADGDLREPEGLPRQPRRRLRLHPRHRPDRRLRRHAELRRGVRARAPSSRSSRSPAPTGC